MLLSALLPLLAIPSTLAFVDKAVHERMRSRSRTHIQKRSFSGRATFYDVGLGACGGYNVASDWIVAENSDQYGGGYPGPNCGRSITISYNGKTAVATIQDECPTCDYGGLDMSRGLFDHFASEDLGEFQMTWWYNDDNSSPTTTTQQPTSTYVAPTSTYTPPTSTYTPPTSTYVAPTSTYTPPTSTYTPPTSTYVAPTTTSSTVIPTSTTSSLMSSTTASLSASITSSTTASFLPDAVISTSADGSNATATATGTDSASDPESTSTTDSDANPALGNLVMFNQAVAYLGHIVVVGAGGK
ncbi:RlpA-like double-psi beta-barrel-protein domain-containing protein-containing protein [Naematelia encephala]|uniref:RlpA-like double-psi beta-barrel-protein domain-containing protein-containing protein n=1 Tax=Naematelia encephala TaxID=71784 RepID=A0A1Y2BGE6_9TREE|nr:RlpA-like double-psi beta-barrel-protein domain-containing protein-containing protein [Naematelia encephala]